MAKDLGVLEDTKLNVGQRCVPTRILAASWTFSSRSRDGKLREVIIAFKLAVVKPHLENSIQFGLP